MKTSLFILMGLLAAASFASAQDEAGVEQRLRESLKSIAVRLRTAETDRANLQAAQAQSEVTLQQQTDEIAALKKQLAAVTKQANSDQDAARKSIDALNAKVELSQTENLRLKAEATKWKEGFNKAAAVARAKEAERATAASKAVLLERKVAERERQNRELFQTGSEILDRYKNFGLGKALLAREPFTATAKVKLQTLVQDYADKLEDNRHNPFQDEDGLPPPAVPATASSNANR